MKKGWVKKPGSNPGARTVPKTITKSGRSGQNKQGGGPKPRPRGQGY